MHRVVKKEQLVEAGARWSSDQGPGERHWRGNRLTVLGSNPLVQECSWVLGNRQWKLDLLAGQREAELDLATGAEGVGRSPSAWSGELRERSLNRRRRVDELHCTECRSSEERTRRPNCMARSFSALGDGGCR